MTSVVELNGRQYDAVSGRLLDGREKPKHAAIKGTAMDFVRPAPTTVRHTPLPRALQVTHVSQSKPPKVVATIAPPAKKLTTARMQPKHVQAHEPQHAKTLMRRAVAKPGTSFKKQAKALSHTGALVKQPTVAIEPKHAAASIDESRLRRAHHVPRSKLVSHFDSLNYTQPTTRPIQTSRRMTAAAAIPVAVQPNRVQSAKPLPVRSVTTPMQQTPTRPASADIFERALAQANSHKQPYHPAKRKAKKSHRGRTILSIAASSFAILLIAGFIAYQNATAIQLRLAASRAGISATLPKWKPSGFTIGKFSYAPGSVTVSFNDMQTNSNFTITQVASDWNSDKLLSDYVLSNASTTYNTIESAGSTIYTYGNNSATWVNNHIWYRLDTNGSLSTSQIVQLATSM